MEIISDTATIKDSEYADNIKIYRNTVLSGSKCGVNVTIGDDTTIERCIIGNYVSINRRNYLNDSIIDDFSYTGINTIVNFTNIGKFCSIARNADIGGADHNLTNITTLPRFRFMQAFEGNRPISPEINRCRIGNDVWIATGAIILNKATIGDGAVIGAGAVVTKDIPPYAIAIGVPAKVVGYRCSEKLIQRLCDLKWWDFPLDVISKISDYLLDYKISEENIDLLEDVKRSFSNEH